jgi:putative transposase
VSNKKGDRQPYFTCLDELKQLKKEQTALTVLHTDQGSVYSSQAFNEGLSDYNIELSMSRAGTPTDNPVIEAINGWVKDEIRCDFNIDAEKDVEDFIKRHMLYFIIHNGQPIV